LKKQRVTIIRVVISEKDQTQLMSGIVEDLLLKGQFAALEGYLSSGGRIREGVVHGVPHIDNQHHCLLRH